MLRTRLGIPLEAGAVVLGVATAVITVAEARPGNLLDSLLIAAAVLWGGAGVTAALVRHLGATSESLAQRPATVAGSSDFTTLVRLGDVPDDVARTSISVAASAGPVVVLAIGRDAPSGLPADVTVVSDSDPAAAFRLAVENVRTEAVLLVSARAMPVEDAVRRAAAALATAATELEAEDDLTERRSIGWVLGRSRPLNRDRFGVDRRDRIDAVLRHDSAHHGLWLWEPDALVVRTHLLRRHPPDIHRPLGSWLRDRVAAGWSGAVVEDTLTMRSAPVAADSYWPEAAARQRGQAADLSDAAVHGPGWLSRLQALLLLARVLSGWTAVLWAATLLLATDGLPVQMSTAGFAALLASTIILRWLAVRVATGVRPAPVLDLVSAAYALPGSLGATAAALTRRVRRPRMMMPTRPLVWVALAATTVAAYVLLSTELGAGSTRVASVLALGLLVLLWALNVRFLTEKDWSRAAFRVGLDLPAELIGSHQDDEGQGRGRVVDGSPGGLAFEGTADELSPGDEVDLRVDLSEGSPITVGATVASVRRRHGRELMGVQIRALSGPDATQRWALELFEAARERRPPPRRVVAERVGPSPRGAVRWVDRALVVAVGAVTFAVLAALLLVMLDLRPLVVRSGSMEPTYRIGDVVVVAETTAGQLRVGEVVTRFDAPEVVDSLTHRVESLSVESLGVESVGGDAESVTVETRGDANDTSEIWTVPGDTRVGVVEARIPLVGKPFTMLLGSAVVGAVALGATVLVIALVLFLPRLRTARTIRSKAEHEEVSRPPRTPSDTA